MIDFGQEGYSSDKVEKLLKGNRNVHYEFSIQDSHGKTLGWLSNVTASISYDSSREIMRTASFRIKKNELMDINRLDDRVIPWMVLTIGKDSLRWPLGKFVINPTESYNSGGIYYPCEGYDQAIILSTDLLDDVLWFNYGSNYINQVTDLIGTSLTDYEIEAYPEGTTYNRTGMEFDIGTPKIQVANEILSAVNYYPIHFDERGKALSKHYEFPNLRQTDFAYSTGKQSVIKNGISRSMNVFEMANRFIRYTENTEDTTYFRSVYENTNPESPLSIQNRGRIITDIESVSNICKQHGSLR